MQHPPQPVLAGFHPDPSVCRVGDEYFLVTSTFAYFPGLPIHRSRDLVSWELIGYVLTSDDGRLDGLDTSDGVWAPTIRHHDGLFYVVWAEAHNRRWKQTYVSTATNPAGPWSEPAELDAEGIDPSLLFDEDGRCWFSAARDAANPEETGPGELWLQEFDYRTLRLVGPEFILWHGALRGAWVEAPHIYRHAGKYHLVAAEGGTERNHAVTAAVANAVTGPYQTDPRSPLLTHRHLGEATPVQNVGHADVVDTVDGGIAALVLATRPVEGHHVLGREVFLVPARWAEAGLELAPGSGRVEPVPHVAQRDEFEWLSLRGPIEWRETAGGVLIAARDAGLASLARPALLGRRQLHHQCEFQAEVIVPTEPGQRVGMVAFQHQERWVQVSVVVASDGIRAEVTLRQDGEQELLDSAPVDEGLVTLTIVATTHSYSFAVQQSSVDVIVADVPHHVLSTESAGGFVGVMLGLTNQGSASAPAVEFADVRYAPAAAATPSAGEDDSEAALCLTTSSVGSR